MRRRRVKALARAHGVILPDRGVCRGHCAPLDPVVAWIYDRPPLSLTIGSRGAGKSYCAGLATHVDSIRRDQHETQILGGSRAQSRQIYDALVEFDQRRRGHVRRFGRERTVYHTGSVVSILAASPTSVRGPHVPTLRLDEVDEIPDDLREAAMGMSTEKRGCTASVSMCSTWHRVGGPMTGLVDQAEAGRFPLWRFCLFEVLEPCPDWRSGPHLERCPDCPLQRWCHAADEPGPMTPRAKRSRGHYTIESAIQKVAATSLRVFESDFLCLGPRADGLWFPLFSEPTHVSAAAEYHPAWPVVLAVDSGVFAGAVLLQVAHPGSPYETVQVFGELLTEGQPAEAVARQILEVARLRCNGRLDVICTDPAGGARNPVGPTVFAEYERAGLRPLRRWPVGPIADGLALVDSFVSPADGKARLLVHPRCTATVRALRSYRRARRSGQWQDYPEDPQHPHEDLVDALRGGLRTLWPAGRTPPPVLRQLNARQVV